MWHKWLFLVLLASGHSVRIAAADAPETHWAFRQPVCPEPPPLESLRDGSDVRNPIDQFIFQRLEKAGLEPAPEAPREILVRRAYFDLLGLPPTPEQVRALLTDESPEAWPRLIDSLLESKHCGERWARHWLDVARYADSGGYETDIYYRNAWRYRDYVVNSFNNDKPYDVFVQEQIAGDEIWPDDLDLDPHGHRIKILAKQELFEKTGVPGGFFSLLLQTGFRSVSLQQRDCEPS